ncbi:hypothetical protein FHX71_005603 [Promicromonospora sukumoe]|uniref:Uncharacterized protein n=1 Tax=Promicromonospora sukumoe TaxID=88382 RepID=A0A7W3JEY1_9MICO|nr:hypothetical protein [Promicromonospora sukumoe]
MAHPPAFRPAAEPSTGAGWTVVGLLSWWPFGVTAYPHTQRATAALAAGDREQAAAEGAKARRIGIAGLVFAIVITCAAVVAMTAGLLALGFWTASQEDRTESATSYAADDEPGSGPEAGTDVWELREGDCYLTEGLTDVVRTVDVVPCDEPHGGELFDITYVADKVLVQNDDGSYPDYPGDAWMARYADEVCLAELEKQNGTLAERSNLHRWHMAPDAWDWRTMDRRIACLVESDTDLTGRVGSS